MAAATLIGEARCGNRRLSMRGRRMPAAIALAAYTDVIIHGARSTRTSIHAVALQDERPEACQRRAVASLLAVAISPNRAGRELSRSFEDNETIRTSIALPNCRRTRCFQRTTSAGRTGRTCSSTPALVGSRAIDGTETS